MRFRIPVDLMRWTLPIVLIQLGLTGCGATKVEESGLSYAEALDIYNKELANLDRLKEKRQVLAQQLNPSGLEAVGELLQGAVDLQKENVETIKELADPGGVLKDGETDRKQKDLIGSFAEQLEGIQQGQEDAKPEIQVQIKELDSQIAEQQKRVDRAKADRDAAEEARN